MNDELRGLVARLESRRGARVPEVLAAELGAPLLQHAVALGFDRPEDILDVFDLCLSLTEQAPASPYILGLLHVILSNRAWPLGARLAFLRRHLGGRKIAPADDEVGGILFGMNEGMRT